ncbi:hypothetical protein ET475_04000 [Microbacterium protaetiae]|uniref:Uncharacterized protein n=2 Tax=Microbacterium protaetiae TaxID=2509458 RepID=A0A4P6EGF5_9MICO|nr:hypothetical protein ET475_04000 [Microbacterium protaetiae]
MDETVVQHNHAKLSDHASQVPASDIINEVHGDGAEPGTLDFLLRLEEAVAMVGEHTDVVRVTVHQHAEALKQAASALDETDQSAVDDARRLSDVVTQTAQDTTADDVHQAQQFLDAEKKDDTNAADAGTGQAGPASTKSPVPDVDPTTGL